MAEAPAKRALLIALDGAPAEFLQQGLTPNISRLAKMGACTSSAQSVLPTWSMFCYASILSGVKPETYELSAAPERWIQPRRFPIPSVFQLAQEAGLHTAIFSNWHPMREVPKPGTVDTLFSSELDSPIIANMATEYCRKHKPEFCFIHFDDPDHAGHAHAWRSPEQYRAIGGCDEYVGQLLQALEETGTLSETAIFIVSDHAGGQVTPYLHGTGEDPDYSHPLTRTVPWICAGPGVKSGYVIDAAVSILDTTPTIAALLGLRQIAEWEGRVLSEILRD